MVIRSLYILFMFLLFGVYAAAQQRSPFDSLVNVLEQKHSVRFYYDKKQTDGLSIPDASGSLENVLKIVLEGSGLSFYRDKNSRIYISRGSELFTPLSKDFFNPDASKKQNIPVLIEEETVVANTDNKIYTMGTPV